MTKAHAPNKWFCEVLRAAIKAQGFFPLKGKFKNLFSRAYRSYFVTFDGENYHDACTCEAGKTATDN